MHETSGLLDELDGGMTLAEAEEQVLAYIKEHCPDGSRPPLAGNTVATDRVLPRPRHADARVVPALPDRRRLLDQGAVAPLVPARLLPARRPSAATTGRSPTSRRASRSCATTARRSSSPPPGPDSRHGQGAGRRARRLAHRPARRPAVRRTDLTSAYTDRCFGFSGLVSPGPGRGRDSHGGCSSAGRAPRCGRGCRGFKSRTSPHCRAAGRTPSDLRLSSFPATPHLFGKGFVSGSRSPGPGDTPDAETSGEGQS